MKQELHNASRHEDMSLGLLNRRDVDEHILAASVRLNEAVTLLAVEPLHYTTCHVVSPVWNEAAV